MNGEHSQYGKIGLHHSHANTMVSYQSVSLHHEALGAVKRQKLINCAAEPGDNRYRARLDIPGNNLDIVTLKEFCLNLCLREALYWAGESLATRAGLMSRNICEVCAKLGAAVSGF